MTVSSDTSILPWIVARVMCSFMPPEANWLGGDPEGDWRPMEKRVQKPSTALYPLPVVLVSCGKGARANIITLAWAGTICSDPPMVGLGIRPSRHSFELIKEEEAFVVNVPRAGQVQMVDYCGMVSGRDTDKWEACGFTQKAGVDVDVPMIAECPVNIECSLKEIVPLGSHHLFIGEVTAVQVDVDVLDESEWMDPARAEPVAYVGGEYRGLGDLLGTFGCSSRD